MILGTDLGTYGKRRLMPQTPKQKHGFQRNPSFVRDLYMLTRAAGQTGRNTILRQIYPHKA